jgi:hypothetical protein
MIIVTANVGLLSCPSKGQLHQARCPLHRKRESQRDMNGCETLRSQLRSRLRLAHCAGEGVGDAGARVSSAM